MFIFNRICAYTYTYVHTLLKIICSLILLKIIRHIIFKNIYGYMYLYILIYMSLNITDIVYTAKIYFYICPRQPVDMIVSDIHFPISSVAHNSFYISLYSD